MSLVSAFSAFIGVFAEKKLCSMTEFGAFCLHHLQHLLVV
jgi:hypothetical protein